MKGHDALAKELDSLGSRLRELPSVSQAVLHRISATVADEDRSERSAVEERGAVSLANRPTSARSVLPRRFRSLMAAGLATAATILLIGAFAGFFRESPAVAFDQIAQRALATRTLRAIVVDARESGTLIVSGARHRLEMGDSVSVADAETGEELLLRPQSKIAYRIPSGFQRRLPDFYGMLRAMAKSSTTPIEAYADAVGRRYPGHRGEATVKLIDGTEWKVEARVWGDPETKLPVRVEIRPAEGKGEGKDRLVLERIEFDVPLEEALFELAVPEGYRVAGVSPDRLQPALSEEEALALTIVPNVGIGKTQFGMNRADVVASFGEPEFQEYGVYLGYPSRGVQLVLNGPRETLATIIANPMDAASLVRREFPGQTDQGIRIGSTDAEVREAYGEPDPPQANVQWPAGYLVYGELGLSFACVDGKVVQILLVPAPAR